MSCGKLLLMYKLYTSLFLFSFFTTGTNTVSLPLTASLSYRSWRWTRYFGSEHK